MLQTYNKKNDDIFVFVGGQLLPRSEAKVSVFDSSVQGGDAVWEGLRLYKHGIICLDKHLDRLQASAKALHFEHIPSKKEVIEAIVKTLKANSMYDETHIRLTLTRGEKITSGMDPRLNQKGACMIILAEWKPLVYDKEKGIRIISSSIRRNNPQFLDSKIHHNNLLNNILAKIQANVCGVDAAIMLDQHGFVSELNDSNLFMINDGGLFTPFADSCLPGITRQLILDLAKSLEIPTFEKNLSLVDFYTADEVFVTGTMGEMTPVREIDGRLITNKSSTHITEKLNLAFKGAIAQYCEKIL